MKHMHLVPFYPQSLDALVREHVELTGERDPAEATEPQGVGLVWAQRAGLANAGSGAQRF